MNVENEMRYYLEFVPYEKSDEVKKNKCKFDKDKKRWYTLDPKHKLIDQYKKVYIDFKEFQKEKSLFFDPETKKWFTYSSNDFFEDYI